MILDYPSGPDLIIRADVWEMQKKKRQEGFEVVAGFGIKGP